MIILTRNVSNYKIHYTIAIGQISLVRLYVKAPKNQFSIFPPQLTVRRSVKSNFVRNDCQTTVPHNNLILLYSYRLPSIYHQSCWRIRYYNIDDCFTYRNLIVYRAKCEY